MIEVFAKLFGTASTKKNDTLIRQIVDASVEGVCERVTHSIDTMSLSEARGYIRARAARVVLRETRLAIQRLSQANAADSEAIARAATERLVPVVLRRLSVGIPRSATLPMAA